MRRAVVSLGSNIEPARNIAAALAGLERMPEVDVVAASPVYSTSPVGGASGPDFLNAAVLVDTGLEPAAFRGRLRQLEADLGRVRTDDPLAPRPIDLDLVLFEGFEGSVDGTVIPAPDLIRHAHVAVPAADVAPDWECGPDGKRLKDIAADFHEEMPIVTTPAPLVDSPDELRFATEENMEAVTDEVYRPDVEALVERLLALIGEDPTREGLARTPLRVAKALDFLTSGYDLSADEVVNGAVYESEGEEMVFVRDIEFYSLCEHHVLPFFGRAHVAYTPRGRIIGLSKIARVVDVFARRLQVQERLTNQIADAIEEVLRPYGVAVVIEASHFCMMMRGVQKQASSMVTSAMRGGFKENPASRAELMALIRE